ncbi:DUF2345 domain-containing protein [Pragia fontium]|uniref:DUF2345 domain-containing protein n=1 Tax=Pragia fontium TaxID=82985 RepID=UPI00069AEF81|nr:type VI secretion system Vgr family protein [Pragia fontium]
MKDQLIKKGKDLLDEQLQAYDLGGISGNQGTTGSFSLLNDGLNRYQLSIEGVSTSLSVLSVQGREHLSEPWQYAIQFTAQHGLTMEQVLSENAVFTLAPGGAGGQFSNQLMSAFNAFGSLVNTLTGGEGESRVLYGVVTAFSQLATSVDEARYEITLSPRLALLDNTFNSAIYQNQTIPQVVEAVLRNHELTGVDFRFELNESYPTKEYITQWQESDLAFIRRLLADSGIWFRFESHAKHSCDVVVFGDSEQQYQDGPTASYRQPSGNNDNGIESVWEMSISRKTVPQSVLTQDYNYRNAQTGMKSEVNGAQKDNTTRGCQYLYGEHYRDKGEVLTNINAQDELSGQFSNMLPGENGIVGSIDSTATGAEQNIASQVKEGMDNTGGALLDKNSNLVSGLTESDETERGREKEPDAVGQGAWYARLRHQRFLTEQITICGKTTLSHLAPGQILTVTGSPINEAGSGILIVSVESAGDRQQAYVISFTGIPFDVLRPYRPERLAWPTISGTLPARVTSPDNDTYGYLDVQGRYRVKMDFDLNDSWRQGEESLWMRLAKPYAGETYGMHFPLIDGTEVAIAFTEGNPDRPYIAHGMHDSRHPDLVTAANHKRNVIRTPANNKLRMDDERGKEHIKVATEYGKTQLNLGHLVDSERKQRGEGFELRTDEWGAIRAGKGLFISADTQNKAEGQMLDMQQAVELLENALSLARSMAKSSEMAKANIRNIADQQQLNQSLTELQSPGILLSAPVGVGIVSPKAVRLASGNESIGLMSGHNTDVFAGKSFTASASESISLFAQATGIQVFAGKGKVDIQAQSDKIDITAQKNIDITSVSGKVVISAEQELVLNCGGAYIKLSAGNIEIGCPKNLLLKAVNVQKMGSANFNLPSKELPRGFKGGFTIISQQTGEILPYVRYRITTVEGEVYEGTTDKDGNTLGVYTQSPSAIKIDFPDSIKNELEQGPGHWVTISQSPLMNDDKTNSEDKTNIVKNLIQEWMPLPENIQENISGDAEIRTYGEKRIISQ